MSNAANTNCIYAVKKGYNIVRNLVFISIKSDTKQTEI
jgi:hypothetical protein